MKPAPMPPVKIVVPLLPPSVNHYKKPRANGRGYYVTPEATAFQTALALIAGRKSITAASYAVTISLTQGPRQRGDLDNYSKVVLDSLVKAGVIDTDAKVTELHMSKQRGKESQTEITVTEVVA